MRNRKSQKGLIVNEMEQEKKDTIQSNEILFEKAKKQLLEKAKLLKYWIDQVEKDKSDQYMAISDLAYEIMKNAITMCAFRDASFIKEHSGNHS